jgi:WD40 repeat protein
MNWAITATGDCRYVITARFDGTKVWDAGTGSEVRKVGGVTPGGIPVATSVALSKDEKYLVTGHNKRIRVVDFENGSLCFDTGIEANINVISLAMASDNSFLVTGHTNDVITLWGEA